MSSAQSANEVRGVLLPLQQRQLLLPNAAVCEVIGYRDPEASDAESAPWLLGHFSWREHQVPMISFERLIGETMAESGQRARVAICNTLNGNGELPYVGIVLESAPHLARVVADDLLGVDEPEPLGECVLNQVLLNSEPALIPDLDAIERELLALR